MPGDLATVVLTPEAMAPSGKQPPIAMVQGNPFIYTSPGAMTGLSVAKTRSLPSALYAPAIRFDASGAAAAAGEELETEIEDVLGAFLPTDVLFVRAMAGTPTEWIGFYVNKQPVDLRVNKLAQEFAIIDLDNIDDRVGYSMQWVSEVSGIPLDKIEQLSVRVVAAAIGDDVTAYCYRYAYAQTLLARE